VRHMLKRLTGIALAGVMIAAPAVCSAQTSSQGTSKQATSKEAKTPRGDQRFVKEVLGDGMAEVQLGQLAQQRGSSDAVKQFGQRMATDHGKAGDELKQLASQKGIEAPTALDRSSEVAGKPEAQVSIGCNQCYRRNTVRPTVNDLGQR
jgi:putative membrane protein